MRNNLSNTESPAEDGSLTALLAYNQGRIETLVRHPFFELLRIGALEELAPRQRFLSCIQCISRHFQTILLTRQALCQDSRFREVFALHLAEEFGHEKLIANRPDAKEMDDPVLEALLCWFSYQMVVLDNAEKAALVHLVLEEAGDHFHTLASGVLGRFVQSGYFETHAELDEGHALMGTGLLVDLNSKSYIRLQHLVAKGWDMMTALADRIVVLVDRFNATSPCG